MMNSCNNYTIKVFLDSKSKDTPKYFTHLAFHDIF